MSYKVKLNEWLESEFVSEEFKTELRSIEDEKELEDRFYTELEFGTAGLRGVLGAGTNRMNIHTVGKAAEGLARHLVKNVENPSCAIAYDSRIKSDEFAMVSAQILAAHGVKVYLYEALAPVPLLSFAVRHYKTSAGIVITASHNPQAYNGFKVYGSYGGQVTDEEADKILKEMHAIVKFEDVSSISEKEAIEKNLLVYIGEEVMKTYMESIKTLTVKKDMVKEHAKDLKIIYTPIHGSGNIPVRRVLKELGYTVHVVKEQELPDGTFPTAPYPNPENPQVFELALKLAEEVQPDIIFGTDPDCDRVGVIVKDKDGTDQVLSGNQIGMLITYYLLKAMKEENKVPDNGVVIKTIVSTESVRAITKDFGVELLDVLTGFKYIGEKIEEYKETKEKTFLFGFEESFGYLAGTFVRDKDAVVASMILCEIATYYKTKGMTLYDALVEIYEKYGFYLEGIESFTRTGKDGQEQIRKCVDYFRSSTIEEVGGVKTVSKEDYKLREKVNLLTGEKTAITLPSSNVIKYTLEDGSWFVVRPSGTEPKMKAYVAVKGHSLEDAKEKMETFKKRVVAIVEKGFEA
ncbi:phospho-sugar mutase [Proteiniclasticum ruminis]|uniref:Phosphoglucomutase n=1 Tax=Proteiniclasticum ruminis TaxID=398199 RepID=A0A1I4Y0W0_9CLOT|nr:phospho-sugar mutase [Proteiniclasticum ruminis]SFN31801.1 phosphoglucomutase [Proteiniclasticum ruminis]